MTLILAALLVSCDAKAQFAQQGSKLVGTGAVGDPFQGTSVALSADGNTAIVGGWSDNNATGAAWVFTRGGGMWTQQGVKLVGAGATQNTYLGGAVALSADGNTAVVGGSFGNSMTGAAWIFARSGGVWAQQGPMLVGTGASGDAWQGVSVALSGDGNTAIVGGSNDNSGVGAAWVFVRSGGVWTQQGTKLVGTGAVGPAAQGRSVAVSADGNTAIVGGDMDDGQTGAVWVFMRSSGAWTQQGAKLVGSGAMGSAGQGHSVALSADGSTVLVGGWEDDTFAGAAWIFARNGSVWTQQGAKLVGGGAVGKAAQGTAVGLSGDGNTAIVGGPSDNRVTVPPGSTGAAWVFTRSGGAWTQQGEKLVGTGAVWSPQQGYSVALSTDCNTAIVGGNNDSDGIGAAWIFVRPAAAQTASIPTLGATAVFALIGMLASVGLFTLRRSTQT